MKLDLIKSPNEWLQKKIEPMDLNNIPENIVEIKNEMDRVMKENKGCLLYTSPSPRDS